jgi:N-acetylmuramoyl-L-alanine amidase
MPVRSTGRIAACAAALCAVLAGCTGTPTVPPPSAPPTTGPLPPTSSPSASPTADPSVTGQPGHTPVVVLDAGHNGGNATHLAAINKPVPDGRGGTKSCNTTGTATGAGYPEHAFTFDVTARVRTRLAAAGVRVVTTRPDDAGIGPCVDERGRAGAMADADAVVSIHADGAAATDRGYHVALSAPPLNPAQTGPARLLGERIRDAMRAAGFPDSDYVGRNGLSLRPDLAGLNLATRPAVLVECANMRNPTEAALVSSPAGRERYAAAISVGILAFLGR